MSRPDFAAATNSSTSCSILASSVCEVAYNTKDTREGRGSKLETSVTGSNRHIRRAHAEDPPLDVVGYHPISHVQRRNVRASCPGASHPRQEGIFLTMIHVGDRHGYLNSSMHIQA